MATHPYPEVACQVMRVMEPAHLLEWNEEAVAAHLADLWPLIEPKPPGQPRSRPL